MTIVLLKYTKSNSITMFENLLKLSQIFKNSQILIIFGIFKEFLSTQNVNVARFARNVESFSVIFKHCVCSFSIGL